MVNKNKQKSIGFCVWLRAVPRSPGMTVSTCGLEGYLFGIAFFVILYQTKITPERYDSVNIITLVYLFNCFLLCAGASCRTLRKKPSLLTLCPVGYVKRTLYTCGSVVAAAAASLVFFTATIFLLIALPLLFVGLFAYSWLPFIEYAGLYAGLGVPLGGCGAAFLACTVLFSFGTGIVFGYTDSVKRRWLFAACALAFTAAASLMLVNFSYGGEGFVWSAPVAENFENLPLCGLWLAAACIAAAAMTVWAVMLAFKKEKPSAL